MDTKQLKQRILDLAIRGKLVPQDPNDEPASVLLKRIRTEKEQLIAQGKLKKSKTKSSDKPHYENVPFEIPESWEWTQIKEISSSILYGVSESAKSKGRYKLLRITDIQDNKVNWDTVPYTDFDDKKATAYILQNNDILFARTGATVGKSYLVQDLSVLSIYASYLIRIQVSKEILSQYIKYYFESGYYWEQISASSLGIGQPNVNGTLLGELNLPLPPLAEQQRIVAEVEKWFALIDELEANKEDLKEYIKQVKSKVLDLAIHGKLVPQDPNDEPAIELLRRINPNFKPCDTSHYENLPAGWTVCLIKDLYLHTTGKALKKTNQIGVQRKYITTSNLYWNRFDFSEVRTMYFNEKELDKCTVKKGDLLVCNGGDVGRAAIWNNEEPICYQNHISRLRPVHRSIVVNKFYYYIFMYLKGKSLLNGKGVAINSLSASDILSMDVPFPSVEEQKRISEEIDVTFALLDTISAEL